MKQLLRHGSMFSILQILEIAVEQGHVFQHYGFRNLIIFCFVLPLIAMVIIAGPLHLTMVTNIILRFLKMLMASSKLWWIVNWKHKSKIHNPKITTMSKPILVILGMLNFLVVLKTSKYPRVIDIFNSFTHVKWLCCCTLT